MATIKNYKTKDFSVTINSHLNGIELRYFGKMSDEQIEEIKDAGFRWSKRQQLWYAYQNDRTIAFANSLIEKDEQPYNPGKSEAKEVQPLSQAIDNPVKEITVNELAELIRQRNELDKRIAEIKRASIDGKTVDLSTQEAKEFAAEVYGQDLIAPTRTEESAIGNVTPADLEMPNETIELTIGDLDIAKKFIPSREYETILNNATYGEEQEYFKGKIKHVADMGRTLFENRDGKSFNSETQMHDKGFMHYFLGGSDWYICEVDENDVAFGYVVLNGDTAMSEYGYVNLSELTELGSSGLNQVELDIYIDDSQPMEYAINQNYRELFSTEQEEIEKKAEQQTKNVDEMTDEEYEEYVNKRNKEFVENYNIDKVVDYLDEQIEKNAKYKNDIFTEEHHTPSQMQRLREQAKEILSEHTDEEIRANKEMLEVLAQYEGGGGLSNEKERTSAEVLNAFYTPRSVVNAVWQLADFYAPDAKTVLEPSSGIGRFAENRPNNQFTLRELDETTARIAKILHPDADVIQGAFQEQFFDADGRVHLNDVELPKYDIVIGNPPYGENNSIWKGRGEGKNFARTEEYFLDKGLDSLKDENSVLLYVMPSSFLKSGIDVSKRTLAYKGEIIDAYRLPNGAFDSTDVGTDIIVLKKDSSKTNEEWIEKSKDFFSDNWFKKHPEKILGEEYLTTDRYGKEVTQVRTHGANTLNDELAEITRQIEEKKSAQVSEEPYIELRWSEHPELEGENVRYDFKEFNDLLTRLDKERYTEADGGYDKTRFIIRNLPIEGDDKDYEPDRYDIGDGNGSVFDFVRSYCSYDEIINAINKIENELYFSDVDIRDRTVVDHQAAIIEKQISESFEKQKSEYEELWKQKRQIENSGVLIDGEKLDDTEYAIEDKLNEMRSDFDDSIKELYKHAIINSVSERAEEYAVTKAKRIAENVLWKTSREYQRAMNTDEVTNVDWEMMRTIWHKFPVNAMLTDSYTELLNETKEELSRQIGAESTQEPQQTKQIHELPQDVKNDLIAAGFEFGKRPEFDEETLKRIDDTVDWLITQHGCEPEKTREYVERLYSMQDQFKTAGEAFERAKVIPIAFGNIHENAEWVDGNELEKTIGIFDASLDYHTVWDREWAARQGMSKNDVARLIEWDYSAPNRFMQKNENEKELDLFATEKKYNHVFADTANETDIDTDTPDEEAIHDEENSFTVEDEIYLNRISEVFGENASMYAERISQAEDDAFEFYADSIQKEGGYSFKEYAAGQMSIGFIIDKYPEIKEINDRGDIGAELDEIGTDIAYGAYTKESLERKLAELAEKYSHEEITARSIATNYVLEKLSKAGIEVVTDKKIFEKILANETRIQKMVESDEKAQENLESIKSIEVANELLLGSVEDKKDAIKNEKKNQKHPDVLSSANMFFYEGLNYVPVRNFETGESRDINSKHRFNGALIKEPSTTKKFLTSDFYNAAEKNGNADVFYCVQQGVLCFPGTNGIFILSNKFNKNQKGKNEFFHDYDTETEEFRNKNEELLIELNNISFEEKNDKELMKSISEVLEYGEIFNRKNETLGDVRIRKGSGVKADGILHIAERRLSKKVFHEKKELEQAFRETTAIIFCAINNVDKVPAVKETNGRWAVYRNGIKTSIDRDKNGYFVITGFDLDSTNKEAADTIEAVNANYGYTPEFLEIYAQVGAAYASLYQSLSQAENLSSEKPQHFIQNNTTYGFAHNNKIYLNPDVMNSEAAVHEYTHLWDTYTRRTNPELWQKGKNIFSHTQLWLDIKEDESYADIAADDDLVLSECHARICGKVAAQVLERIAEQDGEITKDKVIDWDKEVSDYLYKELRELAPEVPGWAIDQNKIDFLAQPMKDLMNGRNILQEVVSEQTPPSHTIPVSQKQKGDILTAEDFSRLYGKNFDKDELAIWAATDWEGKIDTSKLTGNELENLRSNENFVETEPGQFTHRVLFTSGDIGAKIRHYENLIAEVNADFNFYNNPGDVIEKYQKNISTLEEALPNPIPMEKLHFGVNTTLAEEFELEQTNGNGEVEKINLQESFILWAQGHTLQSSDEERHYWRGDIDWATANVMREEFPENIHWYDIVDYIDKKPVKADQTHKRYGMTDEDVAAEKAQRKREADEKRMARSETADRLFDRFLHEGLSEEDQRKVEAEYNRRFNSYVMPDYSKLPLVVDGMSAFKGDDRFKLYDQQIKGISFLCNKGNGLLAYDVGVGKTAAGIVANVNQLQLGRSKRPLIVVPNSVYTKWYNDIRELFPNVPVNDLYNLNKESTAKFRDSENPHKLNIPEGSISIVTYEALTRNMSFTDESCENELYEDFSRLLSENLDDMSDDRNATERAKDSDKIKNAIGAASQVKNPSYVFFEECGWDNITVDEAHNFKNLWTVPRSKRKGESNEFSGIPTGKPSQRALKLYGITQLVQRNNDSRNVFLLTATPFTNSPLEVYSMMSYVGRQRLLDSGIYSLRDFLTQFAHTKLEIAVNAKGEIDYKQVMKDWKELPALQSMLTEYIDKVDGEEAGIIRPQKFTHVKDLDPTPLQKQMIEADTEHMLEIKEGNSAAVIVSMNAMRLALVAPALADRSRYEGLDIPSMEQLVETSPKLKFVCDSIIDMYKDNPEKGQFMYMPLGQQAHGVVKDYLVSHGIPKDAVEIINGSINNSTEKKERVTSRFNDEHDKLKIIIGGKNTSEGIDLNGNSFVMYNCSLGWNPSETIQAEGRIWRQGNMQGHVHCVYPVMNDSIDSVLYQKHDEKRSRINDLWTYKGDNLNVEDIKPEDLKFDLIKDPMKRAKLVLDESTKELKAELSKTSLRIKSYDEAIEKKLELTSELEEAKAKLAYQEKTKADYESRKLEVPYWLKEELSNSKKEVRSASQKLETVTEKLERMGIHNDDESQSYIRNMNVQKRELEKQIEMKKEELPDILEKLKLEMLERKITLPPVEEQRKELCSDIVSNLRPMKEVEVEIKQQRFEKMIEKKFQTGEITSEQHELYKAAGFENYQKWLDGEIESLENIHQKTDAEEKQEILLQTEKGMKPLIEALNGIEEKVDVDIPESIKENASNFGIDMEITYDAKIYLWDSKTKEYLASANIRTNPTTEGLLKELGSETGLPKKVEDFILAIENENKPEIPQPAEQKTDAAPMQMDLFDNDELDAMNGITAEPAQPKLNYQLITYSTDSGFAERESYETKQMANEAGKKFMVDWGLGVDDGGFVAFNTETKEIGGVFGNFPIHEYFPVETLKANGMESSETLKQEVAVAAQKHDGMEW